METAYRKWERESPRPRASARGSNRKKVSLGARERRRLLQLGACLALFLAVFIGKGIFPEKMMAAREGIGKLMGADTDFHAAFASLGRSISKGEPVLDTLGELCIQVFGGAPVGESRPVNQSLPTYRDECTFLSGPLTTEAVLAHRLGLRSQPEPEPTPPAESPPPVAEPLPEPAPPTEPAITPVDYSGPALPANATMDRYSLGLAATMSPVSDWWLSSAYGWREHPMDGEEKFHNGVDMAVNLGAPVYAFADGVVDYTGESPIYGLYTQIVHDNGVTTFYCHCSELLVQQGQAVTMGDTVAKAGESGNATGPHLHFELKKDNILLNPIYYIKGE